MTRENRPQKNIFLSYRRDDVPGYVGRLSDSLENIYGADRVFRDVDDIRGGTEWKQAIEEALKQSAVLVLMIGPRWCEIWRQRSGDPVNYVAWELEIARQHGVTIFPVTLGGAALENDLDLGDVDWLRQLQQHDISDRQQRWSHDVDALVRLIGQVAGMDAPDKASAPQPVEEKKSRRVWPMLLGALLLAGIAGVFFSLGKEPDSSEPVTRPVERPSTPVIIATEERIPVISANDASNNELLQRLNGVWVSQKNNTVFKFKATEGTHFKVAIDGYGRGEGRSVPRMPNKIRFAVTGEVEAEFSLSNSSDTMTGWYRKPGAARQTYDTLVKQ